MSFCVGDSHQNDWSPDTHAMCMCACVKKGKTKHVGAKQDKGLHGAHAEAMGATVTKRAEC